MSRVEDTAGREMLLKAAGLRRGCVLDVGMGGCACMAFFLARKVFEVIGIDRSSHAVHRARVDAGEKRFKGSFEARRADAILQRYHLYPMRDLPNVKAIPVPSRETTGPYGAKSVSEICINGAGPGINNALYNACGIRLHSMPFTPEKVWKALQEKEKKA